jgi:transcriptional regulator with XRE-family HTH domain
MDKEFEAIKKVLALNVRMHRREKGLSQEALAFEAEIDRTYVSQIERSVINPSLLVLHKVSKALDIPVIQLLSPQVKGRS